jgi:hypothetical protein
MTKKPLLVFAFAVLALCVMFRQPLERDPVTHVLVLLPALASAGWLLAVSLGGHRLRPSQPNAHALTLLSVFTVLFWMLPRYIDASLADPVVEAAKFVSIPLLIGAVLAISWTSTHPFLRGFLKANALSMLGVLAFLYTHAPVRICNSYLVSDQQRLGVGFLFIALALGVVWTVPLFFPKGDPARSQAPVGKATA